MRGLAMILLFTLSSCKAQDVVLAKGVIYSWQIVRTQSYKVSDTYFNFRFKDASVPDTRGATKPTVYGSIGFVGWEEKPELVDFIARLREAANASGSYDYGGLRFHLILDAYGTVILYDWDYHFIRLSRANAKALATDIEKSINLYPDK